MALPERWVGSRVGMTDLVVRPLDSRGTVSVNYAHVAWHNSELRSCVKVKVAIQGSQSPSLTVPWVSVDAKQH